MSEPGLSEPTALLPAELLAGLDRDGLVAALRPLWEDAGPLADVLVGSSASSWEEHLDQAAAAVAHMDDDQRAALLNAHPRLGAPPRQLAQRSATSWAEQGGDMRAAGTDEALAELNDRYEARFGFPFVEWVAGRPLHDIVPVLSARLTRDRPTELQAGCAALVAIAGDRLARLRKETA